MSSLNVAVVHYHFRRGGVTRVIENAVRSLAGSDADVAVLVGEDPPEPVEYVHTVGGLGYADHLGSISGRELADSLRRVATKALGRAPDLWHVHNHSLGKNPSLPEALHHLACEREALLLQVHDFAEDGRPGEYRLLKERLGGSGADSMSEKLYPQAPQVHYAVLNWRDFGFLGAAGIEHSRRHLLANAVAGEAPREAENATSAAEGELHLYPTRAIRRKNLGELLLWAAVAENGVRFGTTLAPENPAQRPVYDRWLAFSRELELPVEFELGSTTSLGFAELIASAHRLVTTSVAEGFGMAFLEPWLFGRAVLGRDLQEITGDFTREGIDLSTLYPRVGVPASWVDETNFRERLAKGLASTWQAYGREPGRDSTDQALRSAEEGGRIDFGRLDEPLQEKVLRRLVESRAAATEISPERLERETVTTSMIQRNAAKVREHFGLASYGERLFEIYRAVVESPREKPGPLRTDVLLDQFLAPERFCLLRT